MKKMMILFFVVVCLNMLTLNIYAYTYIGTGKWSSSNVNYAIADAPTDYTDPINWAADMWTNNTDFKMSLNDNSQVNAYAYNYGATSWNGITYINGKCTAPINETYSYANIQLNRYYLDSLSAVSKKIVACHEFGHTASLNHVTSYTMMYGSGVLNAYVNNPSLRYSPAQDDINGINNRY